jgi:hypothetical protein
VFVQGAVAAGDGGAVAAGGQAVLRRRPHGMATAGRAEVSVDLLYRSFVLSVSAAAAASSPFPRRLSVPVILILVRFTNIANVVVIVITLSAPLAGWRRSCSRPTARPLPRSGRRSRRKMSGEHG